MRQQAADWIAAVTGEAVATDTAESFQESLKDGSILCKLINVLQPGFVVKINTSKMAFKMVIC